MSDEIKKDPVQQVSSNDDLKKENEELKARISSLEQNISDSINKAIEKHLNTKQARDTFDEAQRNSQILEAERTEKIASIKEQRISRLVRSLENAVEDMNGLIANNNYQQGFFAVRNKRHEIEKKMAFYCNRLGSKRFAEMIHENIKNNRYKT